MLQEYINLNKPKGIIRANSPWKYLSKEDYAFITGRSIGKGIKHSHSGTSISPKSNFVSFLTSDLKELFNKLNILIAEKDSGHTNILTEATAIVDELRRLGLLTISQIKKIYKLIV